MRRVMVGGPPPIASGLAQTGSVVTSGRGRDLAGVAGALTFGAGLIHAVAAASHRSHELVAVAFALTAVLQVVAAAALALRQCRQALLASALLNTCLVTAWLASRLTGLPFLGGWPGPEAVGVQDLTTAVMEAAAAVAALVAARQPHHVRVQGLSPAWALAAVPVLIAVTAPHSHPGPLEAHHRNGGVTLAGDPVFSGADTSTASEEKLQAAKDLVVRTRGAVTRQFSDEASVVAAGYRSIGDGGFSGSFEHFVKASYLADGRELDPDHIESIVLETSPSGKRIASAMFVLEMGKTMADLPDIAGDLTAWHDHQDLCWDMPGMRLAGRHVNGRCLPGGILVPTPPMLHVWLQDHRCGPFAGIDGHGTACAKAHPH